VLEFYTEVLEMRERTVESFTKVMDCIQIYESDPPIIRGVGGLVGQSSTIWDVVTPNFKRKMREGQIVMNPMMLTKYSSENSADGHWLANAIPGYGTCSVTGDMLSCLTTLIPGALGTSFGGGFVSDAAKRAVISAHSNLNSSPVMGGEILATLGQTVSMLKRPFGSASRLLSRMAKTRRKMLKDSSISVAKANADCWLEYRYGWKPLMYDCAEIFDQSEKLLRRAAQREPFRVARGGSNDSRSEIVEFTAPLSAWSVKGEKKNKAKVRASAGIIYQQRPISTAAEVSRVAGLDLRSAPATIWELVPYSFVADWFIGVGDWLQAVTPRPDIRIRSSWVTTVVESSSDISGEISRTVGMPLVTITGPTNTIRNNWVTVSRSVNPSLPSTPLLQKQYLSRVRTVDAAALTLGKITRVLRDFRH
jgi:hypothetical protein